VPWLYRGCLYTCAVLGKKNVALCQISEFQRGLGHFFLSASQEEMRFLVLAFVFASLVGWLASYSVS
jgi:hypothetical protein